MAIGYLLQGLQQGFAQGRERARMAEMEKVKLDYMKAETSALQNKMKADEMKQSLQKGLFDQLLKGFMGGGGGAAMPTAPQSYSDLFSQGQEQPQMSTNEAPAPTGAGGAQAPSSLPELMATLERQSYENPAVAGFLKEIGMDFGELKPLRGIAGKNGQPVTQFFTPSGRPYGQEYPEAVKPELVKTIDAQGREVMRWMTPYEQGQGQSAPQGGGGMISKPAETETVTTQSGGVTYEQDRNKVTLQSVGPPRVKEEGQSQKAIYKSNIENSAIPAIQNLMDKTIAFDSKGNPTLTWNAKIQGTFPGMSQKLGGEIANDAMKIAYALLRPESGAVINEEELMAKISMQLPKLFTTDQYGIKQLLEIGTVVDSYLSGIDSGYQPMARKIIEQQLAKKKNKPGLNLTPGSKKKDDPLGLR